MGRLLMKTMMKFPLLATIAMAMFNPAFSAQMEEQTPNMKGIQVVPVEPTPDPNEVETKILYPKANEMKTSSPVRGQIRVDGIALGVDTEQPSRKVVWNDTEVQSLHIFIDNQPYFAVNEAIIDA